MKGTGGFFGVSRVPVAVPVDGAESVLAGMGRAAVVVLLCPVLGAPTTMLATGSSGTFTGSTVAFFIYSGVAAVAWNGASVQECQKLHRRCLSHAATAPSHSNYSAPFAFRLFRRLKTKECTVELFTTWFGKVETELVYLKEPFLQGLGPQVAATLGGTSELSGLLTSRVPAYLLQRAAFPLAVRACTGTQVSQANHGNEPAPVSVQHS